MDLVSLLKIALRRWYVVVPVSLIGLVVAAYVQVTTPAQYQATGSILLASPDMDPARGGVATVDAREVATELSSDPVRAELREDEGARAEYAISPLDDFTFEVAAEDEDDDDAVRTSSVVAERFVSTIDDQQEGTPEPDRLRARILTTDLTAEIQEDGSSRAVTIVLVEDPAATVENPYPPAAATARVVEVAIESDEGRARVSQATGPGVDFDVSQEARDAAPIVTVDIFGPDQQRTLQAFEHVRNTIDQELDERQARANVPARRRTTTDVLAAPLSVVDVSPPLNRAVAAIIGVAGLAALGLAFLVENLAGRRSRTRRRRRVLRPAHREAPARRHGTQLDEPPPLTDDPREPTRPSATLPR